jgi:hypothetical protein
LASVGPQNALVPVSKEDKEFFRSKIETMLKNPKCRDFIDQLHQGVQTATNRGHSDVLTAFDQITFKWGSPGWFGGLAHNDKEGRWAQISENFKTEKFISADRSAVLARLTADAFLGETMHLVNTSGYAYSDADYANVVNAIRVKEGKDQPQTFSDRSNAEVWRASMYWHPKVDYVCDPPRP